MQAGMAVNKGVGSTIGSEYYDGNTNDGRDRNVYCYKWNFLNLVYTYECEDLQTPVGFGDSCFQQTFLIWVASCASPFMLDIRASPWQPSGGKGSCRF